MNIVSLFNELAKGIFTAEENFLQNPRDFHSLETSVKSSTESFAAKFLGAVLSDLDEHIRNSSWREGKYTVHRRGKRTVISSVGDMTFDCTYYRGIGDRSGFRSLLEDLIGLGRNEKFTEAAETIMLTEALKKSYQEAADILPSRQKISKTTVMNKVHGIADEIPDTVCEKKKTVPYLFIEADEDHIAEQHGKAEDREQNGSFISRLAYVYEYKKETPVKGRHELVNKHYVGGLYPGSEGTRQFWEKMNRFIDQNYEYDAIRRIFISGDGAGWIKSGASVLNKAVFCADKYHLMQYLNAAAAQMLDEKENVKADLWHILHSKSKYPKERFVAYTAEMMKSAKNPGTVEQFREYVLGNWSAVRRTLRNRIVTGCSAESHVSHVYSDRMSSRPMGWSQTGADRMSKLRCYEQNNGREKIVDLVRYSRRQRRLAATGTEDLTSESFSMHDIMCDHYDQARSYIERMQVHFPNGSAKKIAAIRNRLSEL